MTRIQYLVITCLIGLSSFAQEIITIKIKENKVPCTGVAPMECLKVQIGKNKEWTYFYDAIEGFDYEPGFKYKVKVEKSKKTGSIPADASVYKYKLKKIISKKKVKKNKVTNNEKLDIYGKKLVLTQLNGKAITNESVYFEMNESNKSISGKSGVNRFNSRFEFTNGILNISSGMGTLMAGNPEAMELENEFLKALTIPFKVVENKNEVKFINAKNNAVVMVFNIPTAKSIWSFIDGKRWKLIMLDNESRDFGSASLEFNVAENSFSGSNGCNRIFGKFSTSDDEITFKNVASSRMFCSDKDVLETERKMMNYLNSDSLRFDVADQVLNFYKENKLIMIFGLY